MLPDPIEQFRLWFDLAVASGIKEPNAMTLATAAADGHPSARVVLLKGVDQRGFIFFTNYLSRKGRELHQNPRAALVFYWSQLDRQIRITGRVSKIPRCRIGRLFQFAARWKSIQCRCFAPK